MYTMIDTLRLEFHLAFWRTAAWCAAFAVRHRRFARLAIRYGPVMICGASAFILGRLLGAAVLALLA